MSTLRAFLSSALLFWFLLLTTACAAFSPPRAKEMVLPHAPGIYTQWWHQVEICSGKSAQFDAITWDIVSTPVFDLPGFEGTYIAAFIPWQTKIIIGMLSTNDERIVRHEMLHAILYLNHIEDNDQKPFFDHQCEHFVAPF